jgi:glycosyltransferase involved in cell wall biosynthesis
MRVLLVTDEMEVGGTQRQIVNLACGLKAMGCDVAVLYFRRRSFLVDELEQSGVTVIHCAKPSAVDPGFLCALTHAVRSGRYHVVHAFAFSAELWTALALWLAGGGRRPSFVSSVRGTYDWYTPWQWRVKAWVTSRSAAVVANSLEGGRFAAQKMDLPLSRLHVAYNGVQLTAVSDAERERARGCWPSDETTAGGSAPALRVLFVGRLVEVKSLDTLIEALGMLPSADVRLVVCGEGPLRGRLERLAEDAGTASQVTFVGERRDVPALMAAADVLVLPSRQEGLSNALLEAMAAGLPVVASRVGGNVELVSDGRTGFLFPAGDPQSLARALLTLQAEPTLRARLGQQARAWVDERFSVDRMVSDLHRLYVGVEACRGAVTGSTSSLVMPSNVVSGAGAFQSKECP